MTHHPTRHRVAFLGTGLMGAPMAARLVDAGHDVGVWNRSLDKAQAIVGAVAFQDPREAVHEAEFVCLCLTDATAVDAVLFGDGGAAAALSPTATIIDFSTIGPEAAIRFADRLKQQSGAHWLDCPVSGGVAGAQSGRLAIFAGGPAAILARAGAVLDSLASRITHMGEVGAGQATKLCNQLIVSANLAAIAEAIALGERLGVDVARLPEALEGGFADSRPLQLFGVRMAMATDPGPKVSELRTMAKDVRTIASAALASGLDTALLARVAEIYQQAIDAGLANDDLPALMRLYRCV